MCISLGAVVESGRNGSQVARGTFYVLVDPAVHHDLKCSFRFSIVE